MKNLKIIRKSLNYTQKDVAQKLNIAEPTYSHYESGRYEPNTDTLVKLADFFGCSVDYLLGHQTKNIVYLDSLTENQKEAISLIKTLSDRETAKVIGYIERIKETPLEDIILKHLESEE